MHIQGLKLFSMGKNKTNKRGTALCNYSGTKYYCVVIVFGEPLIWQTVHGSEATIYTDAELPIAEEALRKAKITQFKRVEFSENNIHSLQDWNL